ncbi:EAL domain-containing protein [Deferribacter autotrophicus]|uniref:EAL domain-containing protein n=1 Tax=Deferribacter autotrophicus TaxID=500465 RepID=A0A5A8F597_9BACT|nr:EAL domain-containing protein [Deferribacter autotrophicus]KAA0259192.1 EAL domain-containing protein [Deferribacter autotrophicus]
MDKIYKPYCQVLKEVFLYGDLLKIKRINIFCHDLDEIANFNINEIYKSDSIVESVIDKDILFNNYKRMITGQIDNFSDIVRFQAKDNKIIDLSFYSSVIERKENGVVVLEFIEESEQIYKEIFNGLIKNKFVGVVVYYDDKIEFIDEGFKYITNFNEDDVKGMNFSSLFHDYVVDTIKHFDSLRKSGKFLEKHYNLMPIKTKSGYFKYVAAHDITIRFKGQLAGCMTLVDVTEEKYLKDFYQILNGINKLIFTSKTIEEFFQSVCQYLASLQNIRLAWIGELSGNKIKPIVVAGYDEGYTKYLEISIASEVKGASVPAATAIRSGEISINPNTEKNPNVEIWRDEMLERRFYSSCAIPIMFEDEYKYVLNLYSGEPYYFNKNLMSILKSIQRDITFFLKNIKELEFKEFLYRAIENTHDWVMITDKNGVIEYVNNAVEKISGYKKEEVLGKTPSIFKSGLYGKKFYKKFWDSLLKGEVYKGIVINKRKNGELFQLDHTIIPIVENGEVKKFVSIAKDISKELALEQEILRFKFQDLRTGLLNRQGFIKEVRKEIDKYRNIKPLKAIIVIDIFGFSHLNEIYGASICDNLLIKLGEKLKETFFSNDIIGRTGSDEFAVFLMMNDSNELSIMLKKVYDLLEKPLKIDSGEKIKVNVNIGIKTFEFVNEDITDVLYKAELALNIAKKDGENRFRFYNEELNKEITEYFDNMKMIIKALEEKRFVFYLQPIYDTTTLNVTGFEALVRINHPEKGIILPVKFIDIVEKSALLKDFEKYLFEMIVDYLKKMYSVFNCYYNIAINVSVNSFKTKDILLYAKNIPQELIRFVNIEVTERVFAENTEDIIYVLNELKSLGFTIEIDDFGTGYSSLSYIEKIPTDIIKIDMSFVRKINQCSKTKAVVKTIIELAKGLGLKTIAEGVETAEQYNILKALGCDFVQGYYFAKPLSLDDVLSYIKEKKHIS